MNKTNCCCTPSIFVAQNPAHLKYLNHVNQTMIALKAKRAITDCAIIHAKWIAFVRPPLNVSPLNIGQCAHVPMDMKEIRQLNVHQLHHVRITNILLTDSKDNQTPKIIKKK